MQVKKSISIAAWLSTAAFFALQTSAFAEVGSRSDFLTQGSAAIQTCQADYQSYLAVVRVSRLADETKQELNDAMERAGGGRKADGPSTKTELYHKECVAARKQALLPEAKRFVSGLKRADDKVKARKAIAQWMTAMDAIGSSVGDSEAAKYETLANEIRLGSM